MHNESITELYTFLILRNTNIYLSPYTHTGVNKQAVPLAIRKMDALASARKTSMELLRTNTETAAVRKTSLDLHIQSAAVRKNSVAANACEGMQLTSYFQNKH